MNRFKTLLLIAIAVVALVTGGELSAAKRQAHISVAAGDHDRHETIVSFALPSEFKKDSYALRDATGQQIPLQIDADRQASFVLPALKAGETRTYQLVVAASKPSVSVTRRSEGLDFKIAGRNIFTFVTTPAGLPDKTIKPVFLRGGYIHPVYTPSGQMVTDDYPSDHYHHHGIWFAWTKTEFEGAHPDFWNVGDKTARVDFDSVEGVSTGPVYAGFKSRQRYIALTGSAAKTALNEQWDVRVYNIGQGNKTRRYFLFDIVATQQCASDSPLILEEYRYGGMGVRGHRNWRDKSKVWFVTSEGKSRESGNATKARWIRMSGLVDEQLDGIAVLDHPDNFRAPEPLRIHPDDPYFNYAPSQLGRFEIKPGEKFVFRYRFIVGDGAADKTELDRLWADYAAPPQVSLDLK